jgi:hypothetical protein
MPSPSQDLYATRIVPVPSRAEPGGYARSVYYQGLLEGKPVLPQPPALQQPELKPGQQYMKVKHVPDEKYTVVKPGSERQEPPMYLDQYPPNDPYWATGPRVEWPAPSRPQIYQAPAVQDDYELRIRIQGFPLPLSLSLKHARSVAAPKLRAPHLTGAYQPKTLTD